MTRQAVVLGKEAALRRLYEATSGSERGFRCRLQSVFDLGHELFGLRAGILACVDGDKYQIQQASAPPEFGLESNAVFGLGDTYCCNVLAAGEPIGFADAGASDWATHPCYEKFSLKAYFGSPVVVSGQVYGTLNFSDPEARKCEFTEFECELLRLMARWVGVEIERVQSEDTLGRNNQMLQMVADAQTQFIRDSDAHSIFDRLLSRVLEFAESEYGFIGEVFRDDDEKPYLKTHAITNIAWNEETRRFYDEKGPTGMVFTNLQTLFGRVMTDGKPVIANDPYNDPRRGGLPEGHPTLRHFLGLPIYSADQLVGMMGIANRPGGYDEDICRQLDPFLATCGNLIVGFRSEGKRREVEDALRESEAKASAVLQTAAEGVITIDASGRIESFNPAAEEIFGFRSGEVIGENVMILMPEPYSAEHDGYLQRYLESGVTGIIGTTRELRGKRKDGSVFPLELAVSEVSLGARRLFTGIIRDITNRKKSEEELIQFARRLENNNRELSEFTYVASHDLQEPLRKLVAFSGMLEKDLGESLTENVSRDLNFICDAAQRLQALVEDLLALSRAGSSGGKPRRLPLEECVRRAVDALSLRIQETQAELSISDLPDVWGDRTLLTQLFQNLISNSLKFVAGGSPEIEVACETVDGQQVFSVRDNGIGIASEHAEQVFAPFKRLHARSKYAGTGIGLAICRKAVERHGGRIWVESSSGQGCCFRFTLDLGEEETLR
ncbi:MAG: GAF domain-containing protein [Planctomycetota bacterium]|jgi:PAS domain S-box-containing protein